MIHDVIQQAGTVTVYLGNGWKLTGVAERKIKFDGRACLPVVSDDEPCIIPFPIDDMKFPRLARVKTSGAIR